MTKKAGFGEKTDAAYRDSTNMINEIACNIRTVYSFGDNNLLVANFSKLLDKNIQLIPKLAFESGISIGFSNFTLFGNIFKRLFFNIILLLKQPYMESYFTLVRHSTEIME